MKTEHTTAVTVAQLFVKLPDFSLLDFRLSQDMPNGPGFDSLFQKSKPGNQTIQRFLYP